MNSSVNFVLIIIALAVCNVAASDLWCQIVDKSRKSLEQYCHNYNAALPERCTEQIGEIDTADEVLHLKIGGCDQSVVAQAIKTYNSVRTLDISHSAYTSMDWLDLRLPNLEQFNASNNEIVSIPAWFFKNARRIETVDLSHNKLANIDREAFESAKRLAKIHLAFNRLHGDEHESFGVAHRLQYIDLRGNRYWDVPILSENKHLTEIHVEENPIKNFTCRYMDAMNANGGDDGSGDNSGRVSIYLSWKSITSFAGDQHCAGRKMQIIRNSSVQGVVHTANGAHELHCGGQHTFEMLKNFTAGKDSFKNVIDILPCLGATLETIILIDLTPVQKLNDTSLQPFTNLKRIVLRNVNLTEFDFNWFRHQTDIDELDISQNNLTKLANFTMLSSWPWEKLRELNVAENRLQDASQIIKYLMKNLRKLNLSGNPNFGQLNESTLELLTALETINLASTNLSIANGTNPFDRLYRLSAIDISNNPNLECINVNVFASTFRVLSEFRAANCRFQIDVENFGPLMKTLDLSGNQIGKLHNQSFELFPYLKYLNLSNTNLTTLDPKMFWNLNKLVVLDVSWNHLKNIDLELLSKRLESLNMHRNNLTKIDHLTRTHLPRLNSVRISQNQFECDYIVQQMKTNWKELPFTDDPYDQQHGENCFLGYTINAIVIGLVLAIGAIAAIVSVFGPFVSGWLGCSK